MTEIDQSHNDLDTLAGSPSLEPYSELHTMPAAWDLSELLAPPIPPRNGNCKQKQNILAGSSNIEADILLDEKNQALWRPEPFPEPKTYPLHWDFSE